MFNINISAIDKDPPLGANVKKIEQKDVMNFIENLPFIGDKIPPPVLALLTMNIKTIKIEYNVEINLAIAQLPLKGTHYLKVTN